MVGGCWDSSGGGRWRSRWAAAARAHRVEHRQVRRIQTEKIRGQSSQQRMEERVQEQSDRVRVCYCRPWWCKHGKILSHTVWGLVHQSLAAWCQCEDTYFSPLWSVSEINTQQLQIHTSRIIINRFNVSDSLSADQQGLIRLKTAVWLGVTFKVLVRQWRINQEI